MKTLLIIALWLPVGWVTVFIGAAVWKGSLASIWARRAATVWCFMGPLGFVFLLAFLIMCGLDWIDDSPDNRKWQG